MLSIVYGNPKKRLLVLPTISIIYSLISIALIAVVLLLVDRVLLPSMAEQGKIVSQGWISDNSRIYDFMSGRNLATRDNPVWRSATFPVAEEHPGVKRILVMGDSFVWGDGVANMNDIWWRRLQIELEKRGYHHVQVISAGMCGAATHTELKWAQTLISKYTPDMVIWGYVTNDPEEGSDHSGQGIVKQIQLPKDEAFDAFWGVASNVFPNFTTQLSGLRNKNMTLKYSGPKYGYDYNTWSLKILQGENFEAYKQTVKKLAQFMKDSKTPSAVVTLCMPWDPQSLIQPVQDAFVGEKVDFRNLLSVLSPWYTGLQKAGIISGPLSLAVNPANGHPGVLLTDFYARSTADILEKSYPQVLGEKGTDSSDAKVEAVKVNDFVPPGLGVSNPKDNLFGVYYPTKETDFLTMPLKRPFVELNLDKPVALKEIEVAGKDMKSCGLAVRSMELKGSDKLVAVHDLGTRKGGGTTFKLPDEPWAKNIDEILLTAKMEGANPIVLLKFQQ